MKALVTSTYHQGMKLKLHMPFRARMRMAWRCLISGVLEIPGPFTTEPALCEQETRPLP